MTVLIETDVVDIGKFDACLTQAIRDCLRWKSCPMLNPAESLFLRSGNQLAIAHQCRRGIGMKSVKPKNNHRALGRMPRILSKKAREASPGNNSVRPLSL